MSPALTGPLRHHGRVRAHCARHEEAAWNWAWSAWAGWARTWRERLLRGGHRWSGSIPRPRRASAAKRGGGGSADRWQALVAALPAPRAVWMMVPAGAITDDTVDDTAALAGAGRHADRRRQLQLQGHAAPRGACCAEREHRTTSTAGTSGGVWGLAEGYSLMVGGDEAVGRAAAPDLRNAGAGAGQRLGPRRARSAPATSPRWSTTASSTA